MYNEIYFYCFHFLPLQYESDSDEPTTPDRHNVSSDECVYADFSGWKSLAAVTIGDSEDESSESTKSDSSKPRSRDNDSYNYDSDSNDGFANTEDISHLKSYAASLPTPTSSPISNQAASQLTPTDQIPTVPDFLKGVSESSPIELDSDDEGDDAKGNSSEVSTPLPSLPPTPIPRTLVPSMPTTSSSYPTTGPIPNGTPLPATFCEVGTSIKPDPNCVPDFLKGISASVPIDLDADDSKSERSNIDICQETESDGDMSISSGIICID